jgi:hypothetical protein
VAVLEHDGALVVVVADGAGGVAGGAHAAEFLVAMVREAAGASGFDPRRPEGWVAILAGADLDLEADPAAGETTAVVLTIAEDILVGASCGTAAPGWSTRTGRSTI